MDKLPGASADTLRRLLVLARDLLQAPTSQSVLETVGRALQEALGAEEVLLLLAVGDVEQLSEFDRHGRLHPGRRDTALYRYARRALGDRTPVLLPETAADPSTETGRASSVSVVALPFPPAEPVGVLAALWRGSTRKDQLAAQVPTLRYLGELTAAALGNAALHQSLEASVLTHVAQAEKGAREHAAELGRRNVLEEELKRIAITDVMTGMLNRRGFFLEAERDLRLAQRRRMPSALIFADLDGLKAVNDALGHEMGDALIRDGAALLRALFRDIDVVARLGGDEFAIFTLDCVEQQDILDRIRSRVDAFNREGERPYRMSFSIGIVACDPAANRPLSEYLALADQRMYAEKRSDRATAPAKP